MFYSISDMKGFIFIQGVCTERAYLDDVRLEVSKEVWLEVIMCKKTNLLIDFEKHKYSQPEFKEVIPLSSYSIIFPSSDDQSVH